jgi:anti-anti-sigma regulatory factor
MAFEMEGAIAIIPVRGEFDRCDLETLDGYVTLAEENDAVAILVDVTQVARVPTSVVGALVRTAQRLRGQKILLGLIGLDAVRNPILPPGFLIRALPVFADATIARIEIRRLIGAATPVP